MPKKLTQEQRWRRKGYAFETGRISSKRTAYERAAAVRRMIGIPARVVKIRDDYYRVMTKRVIKRKKK